MLEWRSVGLLWTILGEYTMSNDVSDVKKDLKLIVQLDDVFTYGRINEVKAIYERLTVKKVLITKLGYKYLAYLKNMMDEDNYQAPCIICGSSSRDNSVFCEKCYMKSKNIINAIDDIKKASPSNDELSKSADRTHVCPECGIGVGSKDKSCHNCGYPLRKSFGIPIMIAACILCMVIVGALGIVYRTNNKKEAEIKRIKAQIEACNDATDYDSAVKWCEELIKVDTDKDHSEELKALEFSRDNFECAQKFHDMIKEMDNDLRNDSYSSLVSMLNSAKSTVNEFDKIEPDLNSDVGKYINAIQTNPMYVDFRDNKINGPKESLDEPLVRDGFAYIIQTDTELLLEEKFIGEE